MLPIMHIKIHKYTGMKRRLSHVIVGLFFLFLFLYLNVSPSSRPQVSTCDLSKWVVLLTTAVQVNVGEPVKEKNTSIPEVRISLYNEAFKKWWTHTSMNIVIVENSGFGFEEIRSYAPSVEIDSFKMPYVPKKVSMAEAYSIVHAFDNHYLDSYEFVLKVTGKYFLPDIEQYLCSLNATVPDFDLLIQSKPSHCEVFGFRKYLTHHIWLPIIRRVGVSKNGDTESELIALRTNPERNMYYGQKLTHKQLPRIKLLKPIQRAWGDWMEDI